MVTAAQLFSYQRLARRAGYLTTLVQTLMTTAKLLFARFRAIGLQVFALMAYLPTFMATRFELLLTSKLAAS